MDKQRGFALIELVVVIGVIAILSAIGIPAYQNYLRKAALIDTLQTFMPYRTAVELCALEHSGLNTYDGGSSGIPPPTTTRCISAMNVAKGVVSLTGQGDLNGLNVVIAPSWDNANGIAGWAHNYNIQSDSALQQTCEDVFRFDDTNQGVTMSIPQLTTLCLHYQGVLLDASKEVVHVTVADAPSHELLDALYFAITKRIEITR